MVKDKFKSSIRARKAVAEEQPDPPETNSDGFKGPSPNPQTNLVLADIALRGSGMLMRAVSNGPCWERATLHTRPGKSSKAGRWARRCLALQWQDWRRVRFLARFLVGGGLLAKTLYDRHKGKSAELAGEMEMQELADEGDKQES